MSARKIIVGYDRSADATIAARWALDEASRTGAPVEFFYASEWPIWAPAASYVPTPAAWPDSETEQAIKAALNEAVTAAEQSHPTVRTWTALAANDAALELIRRSADASLVVLGSRGHSAVTNLLGSVSVAVSAHAHCPVVVVRDHPAAGTPVVVGFDGSPPAEAALAFAADEAAARGVPLRIIRAWKPAGGAVPAPERRAFDDLTATWREKYPHQEVSAEAVLEHPAAALVSASSTAQLLVVGSRGRGALRGMLLGSVSQHLLRHAACDIAIVHEATT